MNFRLLLLLPLCGFPAWFAGRWMGASSIPPHSGEPGAAKVIPKSAAPAAREFTWEELSSKEPTAANRWRALELFERWAAQDARAAAERLAALPEDGCRLWPGRGALEAFCKVWAARDPDATWQAVQEEKFKAARDTVAAMRAETHPEEIGKDESLDKKLRNLAMHRLAAKDPAAAMRLGWMNNSTLAAALMAAPDPVACWREICASGVMYDAQLAIGRLMVHSPGAARALLEEIWKTYKSDAYSSDHTLLQLISASTNPDDLKSLAALKSLEDFKWQQAMRAWDDSTLRSALQRPPGSGDEARNDRTIFSGAASELLARDPMALLPYLQKWGALEPGTVTLSLPDRDCSPQRAAQLRALIEAAPEPWGQRLAAANTATLEQHEPAFLLASVEAQNDTAQDSSRIPVSGVLRRWLAQDTAAASEWIRSHSASVTAEDLQTAAQAWSGHDPEAASAWIDTLPAGAQKDAAILGLVQEMTPHDPSAAAVWAARIGNAAERTRAQEELLTQWRVWEPAAQLPP